MLFFHGWNAAVSSDNTSTTHIIASAYIANGRYNILLLDWSQLADKLFYPTVAYDMEQVIVYEEALKKMSKVIHHFMQLGEAVGEFVLQIINTGFPTNNIHIVGHSLGGQLAGYVGRYVMSKSNNVHKLLRFGGDSDTKTKKVIFNLLKSLEFQL